MTKASAIANANIALVKYWGKRNKMLMLPQNSSVSMTISGFHAHTTVEFDDQYDEDVLVLDEKEFKHGTEEFDDYAGKFLAVVRDMVGEKRNVKIVSKNNFPTAAGLASSAAGFAALATAVNEALKMGLDKKGLSILARRGSGSATRSILGGFVEWQKGKKDDGTDSYAIQIAKQDYWPEFKMLTCITSLKEKKVKSRAGMSQTIKTSPMYQAWLDTVENDVETMKKAILEKDFTTLGSAAEANALKMHATMITTRPAIIYWNDVTMRILHSIMGWRDDGIEAYFTMDAGPQVKVMCLEKDVLELQKRLSEIGGIEDMHVLGEGEDARVTEEHLF